MTEQTTAARTGLFTRKGLQAAVPLTGVTVEADISSLCARVVVTQRYVNTEKTPIEAVYLFPLDEGAAVCGFEAIIDDTLVVGEVKERDKAFEIYDDAIQQGHGAFLLDEERPDVFQASVGNLPPGKEVLLKLTYVTELTTDDHGLRFAIPTTVSPRYAPAQDRIGVGRPDSETLNPEVAWKVPYGLNLAVRLAMPEKIGRVESPSHPIAVAMEGSTATVTLSQKDAALDRDFVLSVDTAGLDTPKAWIERDDDSAAIAVAFVPKLAGAAVASEVIFLVDRSGSMGGTSIAEVRNALQLCLRSMIPGCYFNIAGFGSTFQTLFPESREYNQPSLTEASAHVAALDADLGGTEILPALDFVLERPRRAGLTRQIVVLTDGQVTNTDAVLALAEKHAGDARIFTFGIGAGASHHLVRGLARAGGGSDEFIYPGERIEPKVVRLFTRLLSPSLTDLEIEWDTLQVTQAPAKVPPVFAGGRMVVYGFIKDDRPGVARLKGTGPSGAFAFDVPVDPEQAVSGRGVATLAARARIRELEESPEWTRTRGSRQPGRTENRARQEIIALSIKYGLISRETSFVAVERRDTPVHGDMQLRRVPVALTSGWGGLQDHLTMVPGWIATSPQMHLGRMTTAFDTASGMDTLALSRTPVTRGDTATPSVRQPSPRKVEHTGMHALVALQRADGSWKLDERLAAVLGRDLADLEHGIDGAKGTKDDVRRAWATALALVWLEDNAARTQDEWWALARKARNYLDNVNARTPDGSTWIDLAKAFLVYPRS